MKYKFIKQWLMISFCLYLYVLYTHIDGPIWIISLYQSSFSFIFLLGAILSAFLLLWLDSLEWLNQHSKASFTLLGLCAILWTFIFIHHKDTLYFGLIWLLALLVPLVKYYRLNRDLALYQKNFEEK